MVCLAIRTKSGINQKLELLVVPHICNPLTTQNIGICSKTYRHLAQHELTDIFQDETLEVDMLVESDYDWQFVTGEMIHGQEGPVAVGTTLGWFFLDRPNLFDVLDQL